MDAYASDKPILLSEAPDRFDRPLSELLAMLDAGEIRAACLVAPNLERFLWTAEWDTPEGSGLAFLGGALFHRAHIRLPIDADFAHVTKLAANSDFRVLAKPDGRLLVSSVSAVGVSPFTLSWRAKDGDDSAPRQYTALCGLAAGDNRKGVDLGLADLWLMPADFEKLRPRAPEPVAIAGEMRADLRLSLLMLARGLAEVLGEKHPNLYRKGSGGALNAKRLAEDAAAYFPTREPRTFETLLGDALALDGEPKSRSTRRSTHGKRAQPKGSRK